MTFEAWMRECDVVLVGRTGLTFDDLPDWNWHDAFAAGDSSNEAVEDFLEEFNKGEM